MVASAGMGNGNNASACMSEGIFGILVITVSNRHLWQHNNNEWT